MQTQAQLRAIVYNALLADTDLTDIIGDRLYTIGKPTISNTYPLLTYRFFDTSAGYAFNENSAISEDIIFQINAYTEVGDITLHKNDLILIDLVALHRREEFFPEPLKFIPERPSQQGYQKKAFRPFGMGKRTCTGTSMARPEGQFYLSKVFGEFNFEVKQHLDGESHFFTMRPDGKLLVKATPK